MTKIPFKALYKSAKTYAIKHSPEILTGVGIAGFISAIPMAITAYNHSEEEINEKEISRRRNNEEPVSTKEKVVIYAKHWWPVGLAVGGSTACIITGNRTQHKRNAAIAAAYTISQETLKDYQSAIAETVDEKKATEIREKASKKALDRAPTDEPDYIPAGKSLYYDRYSGRYFTSDRETIRKICNDLSRQMLGDMYVTLNDVYAMLDMDAIPFGNSIGWDVNKSFIEPTFDSMLTKRGEPCVVFDYATAPDVLR